MKGNNTIHINEATMIEAVQHYFRSAIYQVGRVPAVKSVRADKDGVFVVYVDEAEPAGKGKAKG